MWTAGYKKKKQDAEREGEDGERSALTASSLLIDDDENGNGEEPPRL